MKFYKTVLHVLTAFLFFTSIFVQTGNSETESVLVEIERGKYSNDFVILYSLAIKGNTEAQMALSKLYFDGNGVAQNRDKALYWSCSAAENRDLKA